MFTAQLILQKRAADVVDVPKKSWWGQKYGRGPGNRGKLGNCGNCGEDVKSEVAMMFATRKHC